MAISFNTGTTSTNATAVSSLAITVPAGVLTGDVLIVVFVAFAATAETITASSTGTAPTLIGTSQSTASFSSNIANAAIFSVVAGAGEAGKVITATTVSGHLLQWAAGLGAWTGAANVSPIDVNAATTSAGASATLTCPSATTTVAGDWDIQLVGAALGGATWAGGTGFTQREAFADGVSGCTVLIFDSNASVGGAGTTIGGAAFTNAGHNNWWVGFTAGLKPAGGAAHSDTAALTLSDIRTNTQVHGHNPAAALAVSPGRTNVVAYGKNPKLVLAPVLAAVPSGGSQRKGGPDRHRWWKP